jgi:hypothetical protein
MKYMLLLYGREDAWTSMAGDKQRKLIAAYEAYNEAMKAEGVFVSSGRLETHDKAMHVSGMSGKLQVLDGPYVDSLEQLGGYYVIDVADREAALLWAKRCPSTEGGTVEVRPFFGGG